MGLGPGKGWHEASASDPSLPPNCISNPIQAGRCQQPPGGRIPTNGSFVTKRFAVYQDSATIEACRVWPRIYRCRTSQARYKVTVPRVTGAFGDEEEILKCGPAYFD